MGIDHRSGFTETNIPYAFAQRFKTKVDRSGEIYGGLGVRKNWRHNDLDTKLTLSYQIGQKSGNNRSSNTVYAGVSNQGTTISSQKAGRTAHYINVYGSVLNNKEHWKVVPSVSATLQKRQTTMNYSVKFEYRF